MGFLFWTWLNYFRSRTIETKYFHYGRVVVYRQGDIRRDKGFTIFYIGINLGAFLSSLIVGYVGEVHGWHYGFGLAGIGMTLGLVQYLLGQKYLKNVGEFLWRF